MDPHTFSSSVGLHPALKGVGQQQQGGGKETGKAKPTWRSIIGDSETLGHLRYVENEGDAPIQAPLEVLQKGAQKWIIALVGFFLEKRLAFPIVNKWANATWRMKGLVNTMVNEDELFVFQFNTEDNAQRVLEAGPWHIMGHPLLLKKWQPGVTLDRNRIKSLPLWVNFHRVPLEYWSAEGMSYIASKIGKPLGLDENTALLKRIGYARVCIDVDISRKLPDTLRIMKLSELGDLVEDSVRVTYMWKPKLVEEKQVWKKKEPPEDQQVNNAEPNRERVTRDDGEIVLEAQVSQNMPSKANHDIGNGTLERNKEKQPMVVSGTLEGEADHSPSAGQIVLNLAQTGQTSANGEGTIGTPVSEKGEASGTKNDPISITLGLSRKYKRRRAGKKKT